MEAVIICGGPINEAMLKDKYEDLKEESKEVLLIAADKGLESCIKLDLKPDFIIGDFDSASDAAFDYAKNADSKLIKLNPIKDDTDTEAALGLAYENSDGTIYLLGATGGRLDHFMGNMALLCQGLERNRQVIILDEKNQIRMIKDKLTLGKNQQYGRFVSIMPWGGKAEGVSLKGFKYSLDKATITNDNTLGISNEIESEEAVITVESGILIIFETKD